MIDWRAVGGEFHQIELPAFPGVLLPAVFLPGDGKLYFPVGHVCAALGAQDKRQREKVKRDFPESIVDLSLPTTKGDRPMVCIEWEALGAWLVTIHEGRVAEEQRGKLRVFKTQVWKAASDILMGKHQATALPAPERRRSELAGLRSLAFQTEERVGRLERVVYISEDDAADDSRVACCPHCGGTIRIHAVSTFSIEAVVAQHED